MPLRLVTFQASTEVHGASRAHETTRGQQGSNPRAARHRPYGTMLQGRVACPRRGNHATGRHATRAASRPSRHQATGHHPWRCPRSPHTGHGSPVRQHNRVAHDGRDGAAALVMHVQEDMVLPPLAVPGQTGKHGQGLGNRDKGQDVVQPPLAVPGQTGKHGQGLGIRD